MNRNWKESQKEIADDRYYYARSCIRQNFFPGSEKAFLDIMRNDLGRDCFDDPLHTSCTGIGYHADIVPLDTIMAVVARQFALMGEAGYENFISSCITSFGIYTEILATWEEFPETEERARENLYKATGRTLVKPKNLSHTSDVVFHHREAIAARARHRLVNVLTGEPLRVVEHIGCHYAKIFPKSGVGGSEFPYVLAGMVESWGGECVDYVLTEGKIHEFSNQDSKFFVRTLGSRQAGDYAPLESVTDVIRRMVFNARRQEIIRRHEDSLYREASADKDIVVNIN